MLTVPNILSFLRFPLSLLFFQGNPMYRAVAIVLAMTSDILDGYFARKYKQVSKFGSTLDPLADKFFVITALAIYITEGRLNVWEAVAMLCRDFSVILFGIYLTLSGKFSQYTFRSIICGKITTALQLTVLFALTLGYVIPTYLYGVFILLGLMALVELFIAKMKRAENS